MFDFFLLQIKAEKLRDTCAANAMEKEAREEMSPPRQSVDLLVTTPLLASDPNLKPGSVFLQLF